MVNILEICLSDLINKKILLEGELERIINNEVMETESRFNKAKELLTEITLTYNSIELINTYITKNKKKEEN